MDIKPCIICIEYYFFSALIPPSILLFDSPYRNATFYDHRSRCQKKHPHKTNIYNNILYTTAIICLHQAKIWCKNVSLYIRSSVHTRCVIFENFNRFTLVHFCMSVYSSCAYVSIFIRITVQLISCVISRLTANHTIVQMYIHRMLLLTALLREQTRKSTISSKCVAPARRKDQVQSPCPREKLARRVSGLTVDSILF